MKAILLDKIGGEYKLVEDVEKSNPAKGQILVKSLVTAVNPVEGFMQSTGMLVTTWPIVLGCDASGVVIGVGEDVTKFKKGDGIFGCTTLGVPGHSTFQEYHLMNEHLSFKRPENITVEEAATIGVGLLTAGLGLVVGCKVGITPAAVTDQSPWIVLFGAAGSVGQYAIQIANLVGYKVLAACSPANNNLVKSAGADAVFDYKLSVGEQIAEIERSTRGNFTRVFDASAFAGEAAMAAFAASKSTEQKYFATTNDWEPIEPREGVEMYIVTLGEIGRSGNAHIDQTNKDLACLILQFEPLLADRHLKPLDYVQVGDVGVEEVLKGLKAYQTHKTGKKVIVRIAEE